MHALLYADSLHNLEAIKSPKVMALTESLLSTLNTGPVMSTLQKWLMSLAFLLMSAPVLADRVVVYSIDPTHTKVRFTWRDSGITTSGAIFKEVSGTIWGNQDHPELSRAEVILPARSLDTSIAMLNNLLINSGDFFKTTDFPEVSFKSKAIIEGDMHKGTFKVLGELTVNGISRPVVLITKLATMPPYPPYENAKSVGFEANTSFKRSDFGMGKYAPIVSDELKVSIQVQAIETGAFQAAQARMPGALGR